MFGARRREFIALVGTASSLLLWPLSGRAQHRPPWRIGMLEPGTSSPSDPLVDAFRDGLRGLGYKEGRISFSKFAGPGEATNRSSD